MEDFEMDNYNDVWNEDIVHTANDVCEHTDLEIFKDGTGYCCDCGTPFISQNHIVNIQQNCEHTEVYENDMGISLCGNCGKEVEVLSKQAEWRFYGGNDNQTSKDPSRCHQPKKSSKTLKETFRKSEIHLPQAMEEAVEEKYFTVVSRRKQNRSTEKDALVAVCLFYTYRDFGEKRSSEYVRKQFKNVSKKKMSKAFTNYFSVYEEVSFNPLDLLKWTLKQVGLFRKNGNNYDFEPHYTLIDRILKYLENTSKMLSRGTPQTIAAAATYFYILLFPCVRERVRLNKSEFSKKVGMSDITITKLVREMARITKRDIKM